MDLTKAGVPRAGSVRLEDQAARGVMTCVSIIRDREENRSLLKVPREAGGYRATDAGDGPEAPAAPYD